MIGFDAASNGGSVNPGTSVTWSHTCTGSDRLLLVFMRGGNGEGDKVSGVTYNGVAMTKFGSTVTVSTQVMSGYYLANPATGAHNVVVSLSSGFLAAGSVSYTGAKQTGIPDAISTATANIATSLTASVTTVLNNCWTVFQAHGESSTIIAGTGSAPSTGRSSIGGADDHRIFDSNTNQTPAGSKSMQATHLAGNLNWGGIIVSIAPSLGGGAFLANFL